MCQVALCPQTLYGHNVLPCHYQAELSSSCVWMTSQPHGCLCDIPGVGSGKVMITGAQKESIIAPGCSGSNASMAEAQGPFSALYCAGVCSGQPPIASISTEQQAVDDQPEPIGACADVLGSQAQLAGPSSF